MIILFTESKYIQQTKNYIFPICHIKNLALRSFEVFDLWHMIILFTGTKYIQPKNNGIVTLDHIVDNDLGSFEGQGQFLWPWKYYHLICLLEICKETKFHGDWIFSGFTVFRP